MYDIDIGSEELAELKRFEIMRYVLDIDLVRDPDNQLWYKFWEGSNSKEALEIFFRHEEDAALGGYDSEGHPYWFSTWDACFFRCP